MIKPVNNTTVAAEVAIGICFPSDTCGYCQGICWVIPQW